MTIPRVSLPGGLSCSILGFGMMGLGGQFERDEGQDSDAITIIHYALDHGINLFDTAEIYGAGHSEEILGTALRGRRSKALIATKYNPGNSTKPAVIAACEASLKRLGTDVIDLYQMHWPNPSVPLDQTLAAFEHLITSGKVRAIGFSNATTTLMKRAVALLPAEVHVAASQQEYNLVERFVERSVLPFCQAHEMALLAYSPLAQGKLLQGESGKKLAVVAAKFEVAPAILALQWLMRQPKTLPIPMTSKISHLKDNIAAATKPLPSEAIDGVSKVFQTVIETIPVDAIEVSSSNTGKCYFNLADARTNTLGLSPSPMELSRELAEGDMLKPVKIRRKEDTPGRYELYEGQLRYWAWRIAHNDRLPVPAQITLTNDSRN